MKILLLLLSLTCSFYSFSQNSISGQILANTKKPAKSVTVLLLKQSDSSAITNGQGEFAFEQITQGNYFLKSSMIGFSNHFKKVEVTNANVVISEIHLVVATKTLQDGPVAATKSFLEKRATDLKPHLNYEMIVLLKWQPFYIGMNVYVSTSL